MSKKKYYIASVTIALMLVAGLAVIMQDDTKEFWRKMVDESGGTATWLQEVIKPQADPEPSEPQVPAHPPIVRAIPKPEEQELPPSPALPQVPVETSQEQRKEAFGLSNSVDHVLLKDEPFELGGKTLTIDGIQSDMRGQRGEGAPGAAAQAGGADSPYYAVRIVRPADNVWKIHYAILQEYLARRQVILPKNADRKLPNGRSSSVGKLLKFIESVVTVYNVDQSKIEKNINVIYPGSLVVFFKISDLFKALDKLQSDDWKWIRYVKGTIRLDRPQEPIELLDRRSLSY